MKKIGFVYYDRLTRYEHTKMKQDIIKITDDYLEWIYKYRKEGSRICYQDETWVFKNMSCSKVWKDIAGKATDECFIAPSGKGERSILPHIGCTGTGLLDNCMLLFRGSKSNKSAEYHNEMNWDVFSHWRETKVFPSIAVTGVNSLVFLDRATYYTTLDEKDKKKATSWIKTRLIKATRG